MTTPTGPGAEPARPARRLKRRAVVVALLVSAALIADVNRTPDRQWTARGLLLAIDAYQATLSKAMPSLGVQCRFRPTCSRYTEEAIRRHGTWHGTRLGIRRLLRCGPWTEKDTLDPPPAAPADGPSSPATPHPAATEPAPSMV